MSFDASTIEYRNAAYDADGNIDVEVNHPTFGWIPFYATSTDSESHGVALFNRLDAASDVAAYVPPSE